MVNSQRNRNQNYPAEGPFLRRFFGFTIVILAVLCPTAGTSGAWEFQKSDVPCFPTNDVVYGNGRWVGVGDEGKIIHSTNGTTWSEVAALTENHLHGVIYAGGRFVACGENGTLLTSLDGLLWEHRKAGTDLDLWDITHGAGVYVVTGSVNGSGTAPIFLTSSDLSTWSVFDTDGIYSTAAGYTPPARVVLFGNGTFIVPFPGQQTFTSTDGITWSLQTTNMAFDLPWGGHFHNGRFYSVDLYGDTANSTDGLDWTAVPDGFTPGTGKARNILVDGNRIIVTTERSFLTTTDHGANWTQRFYFFDSGSGCSAVAQGPGGYLVMPDDGSSLLSSDFTWASFYNGLVKENFEDVCHGAGTFVAIGRRQVSTNTAVIWSSPDGATWTNRFTGGSELYGVCHGNGTWVCVGRYLGSAGARILTSSNLTTWTERTNPSPSQLDDVAYGDGKFVAVGGTSTPTILTSPDGINWTQRSTTAPNGFTKITYANGLFVAVGYQGSIVTSPDGINWTHSPHVSLTAHLTSVAYGNSKFLAGGDYGYLIESSDGNNWTVLRDRNFPDSHQWTDIHFDGIWFVAVKQHVSRGPSYSVDGVNWTPQITGTQDLRALASGGGTVVAVGYGDHIISRPNSALPAGPTGLVATSNTLSWNPVTGAGGYRVYKRPTGTHRWEDAAAPCPPSQTGLTIEGLTPGTDYDFAVQAMTVTGLSEISIEGMPVGPPPPARVIINETDAATPPGESQEFVELFDGGRGNSALDNFVLVLFDGATDTSYAAIDLDGKSTDSNGYFVIGSSTVPGVDLVIPDGTLQNGADAVALYTDEAASFLNGTAVTTANLQDAVVHDTGQADDAGLLALLQGGEPQVDEGMNGFAAGHSLQRLPNGSGGLRETATVAASLATPGSPNLATPPPGTPDLVTADDTGFFNTDNLTNETLPTFEGEALAGSQVSVISNITGILGTAVTNGNGDWSVTASTALSEGIHTITATADGSAAGGGLTIMVDTTAPLVTINQHPSQDDPAENGPVHYAVQFSEPIFSFGSNDVIVSGVAGGSASVIPLGGQTAFSLEVSVVAPEGPVIVTMPSGGATDAAGNPNAASTSSDNQVVIDNHGETTGTATAVVFTAGNGSANGWLENGDTDVFSFTLAEAKHIQIATTGSLNTRGQLRDLSETPINDANADDDLGAGDNFLIDQPLPPGTYTVTVSKNGTGPGDAFQLQITLGDAATLQPDNQVGKSVTGLSGDDIYGTLAGQKLTLISKKARTVRGVATIENDGELADIFAVSGTAGTPLFKVTYTKGAANVTAAIVAGAHRTRMMAPADPAHRIGITVKPNRRKLSKKIRRGSRRLVVTRKKQITLRVKSVSEIDGISSDTVSIKVLTK